MKLYDVLEDFRLRYYKYNVNQVILLTLVMICVVL